MKQRTPHVRFLVPALACVALWGWAPSQAQLVKDLPASATAPSGEPPPITAESLRNDIRTSVDIVARDNHQVEEYRVGNNLYMLKVKPKGAPPYYLVDSDGSGNMQWRRSSGGLEQVSPPRWAILKW